MTIQQTERAREILARLEEIDGNKAGAFTLRTEGAVGSVFEAKLAVVQEALTLQASEEVVEAVARAAPAGMRRVVHELRLSERVFRDYAQQHEDKAEAATGRERDDRLWKAKRNRDRADCCKAALDQYAAAIAAMPSIPQESDAEVTITREAYDFLMGEGPLEGVWFGDLNDGLPGAFWWRRLLKAAAGWPEPAMTSARDRRG